MKNSYKAKQNLNAKALEAIAKNKSTMKKSSSRKTALYDIKLYCIVIRCNGEKPCEIMDEIEAESAVDAYNKATGIANELNDAIDRSDAFSVVTISRES